MEVLKIGYLVLVSFGFLLGAVAWFTYIFYCVRSSQDWMERLINIGILGVINSLLLILIGMILTAALGGVS